MSVVSPGPADVKVSVAMITYNHEAFIAQAIESVLMQQAQFEYELVIGEDCSTDKTRNIVLQYASLHPEKVRTLLHQSNLGMIQNYVATIRACRGKYVAILEGDDYWTSTDKLAVQTTYLDRNLDCAQCFHNVLERYENRETPERMICSPHQKSRSGLTDVLTNNFIPHCSVMFRNGLISRFPDWYLSLGMGDWPLHVFLAELGALGYIDQILAVHRIHSGGVWSALGAGVKLGHVLKFYDAMSAYLGPAYSDLIEAARLDCATNLLLEGDVRKESLTNQRTASAILKQWQQELGLPREYVYKALARYCAASIFTGTVCGPKETLSAMMGILRGDASWLSNRGLWSMAWAAATRGQARSHER